MVNRDLLNALLKLGMSASGGISCRSYGQTGLRAAQSLDGNGEVIDSEIRLEIQ